MEWLRTHPYTSVLCAAGFLLVIGAFAVARQARPEQAQVTAWGGGDVSLLDPTSYPTGDSAATRAPEADDQTIAERVKNGPPYTYVAPGAPATSAPNNDQGSYDFDSFIAMLSTQGRPVSNGTQNASTSVSAYEYIPRGLISTTTIALKRTGVQQALYDYGNDIGSTIESFEQQHSNAVQILKGQVEDRNDEDKAAAVVSLGHAFQDIGTMLANMDTVPAQMAAVHQSLAQSYIELGKNLALVPGAERDSDFIQAIQTYNASADTFTKNYIRMVSLFGTYGVTFTSGDPGRVFTFTPQ